MSNFEKAEGGSCTNSNNNEEIARQLFFEGAANEAEGRIHEALLLYRRAVQLVPDIDKRVCIDFKRNKNLPATTSTDLDNNANQDTELEEEEDLIAKFRFLSVSCLPERELSVTHISQLPPELLLYLFKWVVSSDLDFISLENLSKVCRSFYLVARDKEIWKLICTRIWGPNVSTPTEGWREYFMEGTRLRFNGCYISKTTYVRQGEPSFQDVYRLWHPVEYYRYFRFFPGGRALMLTTADEPSTALKYLRSKYPPRNSAVLIGKYHVTDLTTITIELKSIVKYNNTKLKNKQQADHEKTYHVDLELIDNGLYKNSRLQWKSYCLEIAYKMPPNTATFCKFETSPATFPNFRFSRVKSYTRFAVDCL